MAQKLSEKDWKTVNYCKKYVDGLILKCLPCEKDLHRVDDLKHLLKNAYCLSKKKDRNLFAYKGGIVEKEIWDELEIPNINLEDFGCTRYNELPTPLVRDSGYHIQMNKSIHCPMKECETFANWIEQQLQKSI